MVRARRERERERENDRLPPQSLAILVWTAVAHVNFFTGPRDVTIAAGRDAWLATALSTALIAFGVWMPLRVSSMYQGQSVVEIARTLLGRYAGTLLAAALALYWLGSAGWLLQSHSHLIVTHLLSESPRWVLNTYLVLVSTYLVRHGLEPMTRLLLLLLPAYIIPLGIIAITVVGDIDFGHLRPVMAQGPAVLLHGIWISFTQVTGMSALWVVGPYMTRWKGAVKAAMVGVAFLAVPAVVLMVALLTRFGPRNIVAELYPPLNLFELVEIPGFTGFRLDPLFLTVWIGISFTSVAFFQYAAVSSLRRLLGLSNNRWPVLITGAVLIALGALPVSSLDIVRWNSMVMPITVGVFSLGASLLLWAVAEIRRLIRERRGNS